MTPKAISILGCGWLGLPLGRHLVARGHRVKGSTTTVAKRDMLADAGIESYVLVLDPDLRGDHVDTFFEADVLFFNVPTPRRRPDVEAFVAAQTETLIRAVRDAAIGFVVFASSTSIYANVNETVEEDDAGTPLPERASGRALLAAERRLLASGGFDATVLRFAGLYGDDRQPGRFLAGHIGVAGGAVPVNLVHRDDCIAVATRIIEDDVRGEVFNVCADAHPSRRDFYTKAARRLGLEPPTFAVDEAASFKVVSNRKLKERLGYTFLHPDPADDLS